MGRTRAAVAAAAAAVTVVVEGRRCISFLILAVEVRRVVVFGREGVEALWRLGRGMGGAGRERMDSSSSFLRMTALRRRLLLLMVVVVIGVGEVEALRRFGREVEEARGRGDGRSSWPSSTSSFLRMVMFLRRRLLIELDESEGEEGRFSCVILILVLRLDLMWASGEDDCSIFFVLIARLKRHAAFGGDGKKKLHQDACSWACLV